VRWNSSKRPGNMALQLRVRNGQNVSFPVAPGNPLFPCQSRGTLTPEDVLQHPYYSQVINSQVANLIKRPGGGRVSAADRLTAQAQIVTSFIHLYPPPWIFFFANVTVDAGAVLTLNGSWINLTANVLTVQPGGTIRAVSSDPSVPVTLNINCSSYEGG